MDTPPEELDIVECSCDVLNFDFEAFADHHDKTTISSPGVPFVHRLKQRLLPTTDLIIDGVVFQNAEKFSVDLCSLIMNPRDNVMMKNIVLHLNPRFPTNCIVRNSYIEYEWGQEEVRTFRRNPLKRGQRFLLEIYFSPSDLLIAIDGIHFCKYSHRLPYTEINSIEIHGDIILNKVEMTRSNHYPAVSPEPTEDKCDLEMPFTRKFTSTLILPRTILIAGTVYLLPYNFHVNLQSGSHFFPHPVVAFHMSVRWRPSDEDVIVFNSWSDDQWDEEIVLPMCNMFQPGSDFLIELTISTNGFLVTVNRFSLPVFHHRMNTGLIDTLFIHGDISLSRVDLGE